MGTPTSVAKSLPVPTGTTPNGTPVPATAWSARCTVPSPPTATSAPAPSATAARHASSASAALAAVSGRTCRPVATEIAKFYKTRTPPVSAEETTELFAFMEAAEESKRQNGAPVKLETVLAKARKK